MEVNIRMPFVSVPKDLSKVKTKIAFNLTKRQLICFALAAAVGVPTYLFTRTAIGNSAAVFLMIGLMLPFFFLAMFERDEQTAEKILRNVVRARWFFPARRPYRMETLYEYLEIDQIPTVHLDVAAFQMEKRGIRTERGNMNREIAVTNNQLRQLRARISKLQDWLKEEAENTAPPTFADVISNILTRRE